MEKLEGPFRKVPPQIGEEFPILQIHEIRKLENMFESHSRIQKIELKKREKLLEE
jgi:hypothetical protein